MRDAALEGSLLRVQLESSIAENGKKMSGDAAPAKGKAARGAQKPASKEAEAAVDLSKSGR